MPTSVREHVLDSAVTLLAAAIPTATVERSRRAAVDTDRETLPRLIITMPGWESDETQGHGVVFYTAELQVAGYARGDTDAEADAALDQLNAAVQGAMGAWTPTGWDVDAPASLGVDFRLFDAEESSRPAGEFTARFSMRLVVARDEFGTFQLDVSELDGDDPLG